MSEAINYNEEKRICEKRIRLAQSFLSKAESTEFVSGMNWKDAQDYRDSCIIAAKQALEGSSDYLWRMR